MSPEDVNPEWVERAYRAYLDDYAEGVEDSMPAILAAVLPLAQAEAWKQGALTADPNLDPSAADEYNPYEEDKS